MRTVTSRIGTAIFLPYCTSDAFSGTFAKLSGRRFSFLGKYIIPAVMEDLVENHGLIDSEFTKFVLSGSSAGAIAIYPNIEFVSSFLSKSKTFATVDSGWFLDSTLFVEQVCNTTMTCTEKDIFVKGNTYW
jgi:hypothetical protein